MHLNSLAESSLVIRLGAAAVAITAIIGLMALIASQFVLASDEEVYRDAQAQLNEYQSRDINKIFLKDEMAILQENVTKLMDLNAASEFQALTDTERLYRNMLVGNIGDSITAIKKRGGSTEQVELFMKMLGEGDN